MKYGSGLVSLTCSWTKYALFQFPSLSKLVLLEQLTEESSDQECMIKLSDIPSCSLFQIRHGTTCSLPQYASGLFNVRRSTHANTMGGHTYVLLQGWMHQVWLSCYFVPPQALMKCQHECSRFCSNRRLRNLIADYYVD